MERDASGGAIMEIFPRYINTVLKAQEEYRILAERKMSPKWKLVLVQVGQAETRRKDGGFA